MIKLIIEDDEGKTTIVPLIRDEITIGRKEGNTIRLTERNVSRRHAKLLKQTSQIYVEDLGSYNGIKVNGNKIRGRVPVTQGDRIQIGDYTLAFKFDGAAAAASAPDPFEEMKTIPMERAPVPEEVAEGTTPDVQPPAEADLQEAQTQPMEQPEPAPAKPAGPAPVPATEGADLVASPEPEQFAQAVVLSDVMFGAEFPLNKATMVIGRMPENDIVIDHRSISRHHAKIVRDGNHYTIFDLGSQNGIVVNGEKYDRVELRKGDIIDLGHIRFRFVAPGEVFDIESITAHKKSSKMGLYVVIGGIVVLAVILGIVFWPPSNAKKRSHASETTQPSVSSGTIDAGTGQVSPKVETLDYSKITMALAAKNWTTAISEADAFLSQHPADERAQQLKTRAKAEQHNATVYQNLVSAWRKGHLNRAAMLGKNFPKDSVYQADLKTIWPKVVEDYTKLLLKRVKDLAKQKRCAEVKIVARKAIALNPEETRFQPIENSCGRSISVAARNTSRHHGSHTTHVQPRNTTPPTTPTPTEDPAQKAAELGARARNAYANNRFSQAISLSRQSYRLRSSSRMAFIVGMSACQTHRTSLAKWAISHLGGSYKRMVKTTCANHGITLP
ncbi:MAG: FHA domain-containing protein [Deltaproteobacteria bacterium]|nr:FHA domain-containing protein [Deltaproteobacteria bacterium]